MLMAVLAAEISLIIWDRNKEVIMQSMFTDKNVEPAEPYFGDRLVTKRWTSIEHKPPSYTRNGKDLEDRNLATIREQLKPPDKSFVPRIIYFSVLILDTKY